MVGHRRDGILIERCAACRAVLIGEYGLVKLVETRGSAPPRALSGDGLGARHHEGRRRRN